MKSYYDEQQTDNSYCINCIGNFYFDGATGPECPDSCTIPETNDYLYISITSTYTPNPRVEVYDLNNYSLIKTINADCSNFDISRDGRILYCQDVPSG